MPGLSGTRMSVNPAPLSVTGAVVLYDDDCGFCRWTLAKLLAWDRRRALRPVPISSADGEALLGDLAEERRQASWHLVVDGRRYSAGAAFPPLLRLLPGGAPLARLTARMPGFTDTCYSLIAANRGRLGPMLSGGAVRRADQRIRRRQEGGDS